MQVLLFDYCPNLTMYPDLMKMPNLKRLSLELSQEIGQLTSLKEINLSARSEISSLPESIVSLDQLETLSISDYDLLKSLPSLPPSLIRLHAGGCCQLESVVDISNIKGLQELDLCWCERLLNVAGIEQLKLLELLNLAYCRSLCDSIVGRIKSIFLNNEDLKRFIPGRLIEGRHIHNLSPSLFPNT
ncbi:unnamed protein product [Victoria cruziana]